MNDHSNEKRIVGSFLIGGLVGAGLALLFAPQSGKKTRRDITRFTKNVAGEAKDMVEDAAESVQDLVDKVSDKLSVLASYRKEITDDTRKKFIRTLENVQKTIEKQKDKLI